MTEQIFFAKYSVTKWIFYLDKSDTCLFELLILNRFKCSVFIYSTVLMFAPTTPSSDLENTLKRDDRP